MLTATSQSPRNTGSDAVVLRLAQESDARALRRLADLDDAAPLAGDALLAEQDGELRAALSLHSGRSIADPFKPTVDLVTLLRARAALLHSEDRPAYRRLSLLRRAARTARAARATQPRARAPAPSHRSARTAAPH